ncbi:DNA-directed RNA polymerase II subunit RPB7 [Dendrobium catenatum]|uniref:DNA-directed RNA polymerase subunit n=1 Tax=Dendrobium catenatum TaxID=906689 RepID=A0A2I0V6U9_9ASPA|nr:DNA-directed RNA polymerase II subunit RPB7 [Dendrobium catenatum]
MVFLEVEVKGVVIVDPNDLLHLNISLRKYMTIRLLSKIGRWKASTKHGYYVTPAILNFDHDSRGDWITREVIFKVSYKCTTMKPCKGEIFIGTIDKVMRHGIFLKCGPIQNIFLSEKKMKDYKFSIDEQPIFVNMNRESSMQKGTKVRFKVFDLKWIESEKEFHVLATIEAHFLGPI